MTRPLALVSGGTSGIGLAIARRLAPTHDLALGFAADTDKAQQARSILRDEFPTCRVEVFQKILRGYSDANDLFGAVRERFELEPAVLVTAAGRVRDGLFLSTDFGDHIEMIHEHLISTMALCRLSLKSMTRHRYGRILTISSISARFAKRGQTSYAAAKAGIEAFTRTLALEVAHRGVTVNCLAPGLVATPLIEPLLAHLSEKGIAAEDRIPVGFVGQPDHVAGLAHYLLSPEASYTTGGVYVVDGGRSLGEI